MIAPMDNECLSQAHRGLRRQLLVQLKRSGGLTVKQLAAQTGMSLNAVRYHVRDLEAEGLVSYRRQPQGVGAPTYVYGLTSEGHALFPQRYEAALTDMLDQIVQHQGRVSAVGLLEAGYLRRSQDLQKNLGSLDPTTRISAVAEVLSREGYMAEANTDSEAGVLIQHNCPIQSVAERFPEVCAAEMKFLEAVLGAQVHRQQHILGGCNACEYRVRFHSPASTSEAPRPEEMV
jgi:predicted ArsR family transcriptional regulator